MEQIPVMVNGLPGNMATVAAEAIINNENTFIVPYSFTGEKHKGQRASVRQTEIFLIAPDEMDVFARIKNAFPGMIIMDFTAPNAAEKNAMTYIANGIPFVMGTTGWNTEKVAKAIELGSIPAVIAPNLAFEITAIMEAFKFVSENFPGLMSSYSLNVVESHQEAKEDVSATAIAAVKILEPFGYKRKLVISVRDKKMQAEMGIPEKNLSGHAYHTYVFLGEENAEIMITHNIRGRGPYAEGAVKAAIFLSGKKGIGRVFSVIDVMAG